MFEELLEFHNALEEKESARENLIKLTRDLKVNSTKAIAAVHSEDMHTAEEHLEQAGKIIDQIAEYKKYPEFYYAIAHDSLQEYVEAFLFLKLVTGDPNIDLKSLKAEIPSILTGLGDLIGELRRFVLDLFRKGEFERGEELMNVMEHLYSQLSTFYFPDKMLPGLRNKVDTARILIERTKSDYIVAKMAIKIDQQGDA
ncbi:MAG: translin [Archaeoglobaceae archaeon]